ncbi:hypothetical protein ACP70R_004134 [Stipagrostis hirtigluma subsp. patula]
MGNQHGRRRGCMPGSPPHVPSDDCSSGRLDPLTGSAAAKTLPLLPDEINSWVALASGAAAAAGTIFLYAIDTHGLRLALLRPGDATGSFRAQAEPGLETVVRSRS